jgi:hypothetical protein
MDSGLDEALQRVEHNCGPDARQLLLSMQPAIPPKKIGMLSRTSPEYQRHVLNRIRAGHTTPLKKTAACVLVYETVSFREVVSRLERALGGVRKEAKFVTAQVDADVPHLDRGADRLLTLSLVCEGARDIGAGVHELSVLKAVPSSAARGSEAEGEHRAASSGRLHAAAALGLVAKNCRNLPLLKPEHHNQKGGLGTPHLGAVILADGARDKAARQATRQAQWAGRSISNTLVTSA